MCWQMSADIRQRQHFGETVLMQAHFLRAEISRNAFSGIGSQRSRFQPVVNGIENQQMAGAFDIPQQVQSLSTAIDNLHILGPVVMGIQPFRHPHAEAFIGPQQVTQPHYHHALLAHERSLLLILPNLWLR